MAILSHLHQLFDVQTCYAWTWPHESRSSALLVIVSFDGLYNTYLNT
jgi:hypothetical protein